MISDIFERFKVDISPLSSSNTSNTRKRQRNYAEFHKHGLDGSPTVSSI